MNAQQIYHRSTAGETATGDSGDLSCALSATITIDINLLDMGGTTPGVTFAWERRGVDGAYFSLFDSGAKSAPAAISASIGPGLSTAEDPGLAGHLKWTITGTGLSTTVDSQLLSTTVTTGANDVTQTLGDTTGLLPGDTLYFATADVTATVESVPDGATVVLTEAVNTTTGETVTSVATQEQVITDTTGMVPGDTLNFATAAVDVVIVSVPDGTHVIVAEPVASTNSEVASTAAPYVPFSALITGK